METELRAFILVLAIGSLIGSMMQNGSSPPPGKTLRQLKRFFPRRIAMSLIHQTLITTQGGSVIVEGSGKLVKGAKVHVRQESSSDGQDIIEQLCIPNSRECFRIVAR